MQRVTKRKEFTALCACLYLIVSIQLLENNYFRTAIDSFIQSYFTHCHSPRLSCFANFPRSRDAKTLVLISTSIKNPLFY